MDQAGKLRRKLILWLSRFRYRGRIFLSFADPEREAARRVAAALSSQNFRVFFDEADLPPGGEFNTRIESAIRASDAIVVLLSPDALAGKRYLMAELAMAEAAWPNPRGRVLAVEARPIAVETLPAYLSALTLLVPRGPLATEVAMAVNRLRGWRAQRRAAILLGIVIAALTGMGAWGVTAILDQRELAAARDSVGVELRSDGRVISDLKENTITLAGAADAVAQSVRHPGIKILAMLFPPENIDFSSDNVDRSNLYNVVIDRLAQSGLTRNETEMRRAAEACHAISRVIVRTRSTVASLGDITGERYSIRTESWVTHRETLLRADRVDAAGIADLYDGMLAVRRDYDRVATAVVDYLDAMRSFCDRLAVNRQSMSEVLAAERLSFMLLDAHLDGATEVLEKLVPVLDDIGETAR